MYIISSQQKTAERVIDDEGINISEDYLRYVVESIAIPRHYIVEKKNNSLVANWIKNEFMELGFSSAFQGEYHNVVSTYKNTSADFKIIIGAHYDSVPGSPGADDNASAIAGMLAIAKALKDYNDLPILFVAFNREEDGLLGSKDFVSSLLPEQAEKIECVHILEMIAYSSDKENSQLVPEGLPIKMSNVGDFIGIIANRHSNKILNQALVTGEKYVPGLSIKAMKIFLGVEKFFPHLLRSDHAPFWNSKIPALMWTDTSEFRNPNYHKCTDTPDTLNYSFMKQVSTLLAQLIMMQLYQNKAR